MREFILENSRGEVFHLEHEDSFMLDPDGLGFSRETEYQHMGTRFEALTESLSQHEISGVICFGGEGAMSAYQQYAAFARFIQHIPLTLHYLPDKAHGISYKVDVVPQELQKTELEAMGLNVAVTFAALSLFYMEFEESGQGSVQVMSDSLIESPCVIRLEGPFVNPTWTQTVEGVEVLTGAVEVTAAAGEAVEIRTDTNPYQLRLIASDGTETDIYGSSDFSTGRFALLQYGSNIITATDDNDTAIPITIRGRVLYETV